MNRFVDGLNAWVHALTHTQDFVEVSNLIAVVVAAVALIAAIQGAWLFALIGCIITIGNAYTGWEGTQHEQDINN